MVIEALVGFCYEHIGGRNYEAEPCVLTQVKINRFDYPIKSLYDM